MKKRTDYEYLMRRRQLTPGDFYGYLQYELNLDKLREIRCDYNNAAKDKADAFRTVEGSCLRHISYIFDRAIRRFPSEMGLWADYVSFLKKKKLIAALNAVFGKALSLNPKNEDLWLQAAVHELDVNNNLHSARTLLQRSLRANKLSLRLWKKYFELELWNAVRITERQRILGLEVDNAPIQGAPLVVFKYAVTSLPNELDFACELHRSGMMTSVPLGESLEKILLQTYGDNCDLWSYLASLSFDRHVIQLDTSENRDVQGRGDETSSKGKILFRLNCQCSILCYAMLCNSILCYAMQFYSVLCNSIQCYAILFSAMQFYSVLCNSIQCYAILFIAMQFYSVLCYAIQCYAILFSAMLCYAMLCYAILLCAMQFYYVL